jgi:3-oxoacyl-(acyl-carrier-protein) synthase
MSKTSNLDGIAIVGIAARFPGARNADELWRNLRDGIETVSFFTDQELAAAGVDPALLADPRYVRAKGALEDADLFDAAFFGFTPREAEAMDPQHRVFLECAWEALEDAACDPQRFAGRIGVWAGSGASSYLISNLLPNQEQLESFGAFQVLLLNDRDFLATRASYELDLKGPSVGVQTACSTSLVAVHMACQSLLGGECDMALAGGVSISAPLRTGYRYQEGSVMSPDGHCRAFDSAAAGAVEGNGCGIVVLKRLEDALTDGNRVYAVIRGSAVNNDGSAKIGFTAPSVEGQAEVISEALMMAGVEPGTIGYGRSHRGRRPHASFPRRGRRRDGLLCSRLDQDELRALQHGRGRGRARQGCPCAGASHSAAEPPLRHAQSADRLRRQSVLCQHRSASLGIQRRAAPGRRELLRPGWHQRPRRAGGSARVGTGRPAVAAGAAPGPLRADGHGFRDSSATACRSSRSAS